MKDIKELIRNIKADKDFARKYSLLKSVEEVLEQAKVDGYDINEDELREQVTSKTFRAKGELSEEALEIVAGGGESTWCDGMNKYCDKNPNFLSCWYCLIIG